jgi:hypothetical protein
MRGAVSVRKSRSIREVLEALEWVRGQMMRRGSPDFIRQRETEGRVQALCGRLLRSAGKKKNGGP